tara:strand:- start:905 stop:1564 length:660 start_codon:yes stop_codon:yes gene_type:complete
MKDNFDLKKFLVENKSIEKYNPFFKKETLNEGNVRDKIREMIINELSGDPELDYEGTSEEEMYGDYIDDEKDYYQHSHQTDIDLEEMGEPEDEEEEVDYEEQKRQAEEEAEIAAYLGSIPFEESLDEAKEEEEEEVEAEEEAPEEEDGEEEVEAEEEVDVEAGGGLEDIAADMEGNEGDLMDHLISALKVSKGMDNEKLTTQIGNTLKFFVGEYIGGEE